MRKNSMRIIMNSLMKQQCKDPPHFANKISLYYIWKISDNNSVVFIVVKMKCSHITLNFKDTSLETA